MIAIGKNKVKREKLFGKEQKAKRIIHRDHLTIDAEADKRHSWTYMYALPPTGQIRLEDFETAAIDRLKCMLLEY
jgi:hypothetical protein